MEFPSLRILDFASDLRLVDAAGEHDALAAGMTGLMSPLGDMSVRYQTKGGRGWWPTRTIPRLGFVVDTNRGAAKSEGKKVGKALF